MVSRNVQECEGPVTDRSLVVAALPTFTNSCLKQTRSLRRVQSFVINSRGEGRTRDPPTLGTESCIYILYTGVKVRLQ